MKGFSIVSLVCLCLSSAVFAGNYPFPQNVKYVYGIKPANANYINASASYNKWKSNYVVDASGGRKRVLFNSSRATVSEGIGYGMLLSAYADDQTVFDGLWKYYKSHMNNHGVMNWKIDNNDAIDDDPSTGWIDGANGATDAEEDAAMALVIAHYQWGSAGAIDYLSDAKALMNSIMTYEVEKPSYVLKPGDVWGGSTVTNPSYFAPGYYRVFYDVTGDAQWLQVLDKCYQIMSLNADATTGLISDWCQANGNPASGMGFNYTYESTRIPWRLGVDYIWHGDSRAKTYLTKMANFIKNTVGGSSKIVDGYTKTGTKIGSTHNTTFIGPFAISGMVDPSFQTHLNNSYNDLVKTGPRGYFDQMLHTLSLFVLTGNFYRLPVPVCQGFSLGPDLSICMASSYTLDPQIATTGRNFNWSTGESTSTITVSKIGSYILKVDSVGCVKSDTINVLGLDLKIPDVEIFTGDSIYLDAGTSGAGVTYTWNTGSTDQTILVDSAGLYWVQVDSSGCSDRDTIYVKYKESDKINVYPNPSDGHFKVLLYDATADKADVSIYSSKGQLLLKKTFTNIQPGDTLLFDISTASTGIYIVRVETKNAVKTKKFLKY